MTRHRSFRVCLLAEQLTQEQLWTMLHRFRRAMVRPERELLKGEVEVDETYLAISDRDQPLSSEGRKSKTNKILVAIAVEILQPKGFGRIRLRRIDNDSDACVVPFVQDNIERGELRQTILDRWWQPARPAAGPEVDAERGSHSQRLCHRQRNC